MRADQKTPPQMTIPAASPSAGYVDCADLADSAWTTESRYRELQRRLIRVATRIGLGSPDLGENGLHLLH